MTLTYWQQNRPTLSNTRLGHPPSFWWPWPIGNRTDLRSPTPGWVTHLHSDDPNLLATEQTYALQHQAGSPTFILMTLTYWQQNRPTLSNTRLGHPPSFWWSCSWSCSWPQWPQWNWPGCPCSRGCPTKTKNIITRGLYGHVSWGQTMRSTAGVIMRLNHRVIVRSQSRAMIATRTKHGAIVTLLFDFQWGQTVWSHHHPSV